MFYIFLYISVSLNFMHLLDVGKGATVSTIGRPFTRQLLVLLVFSILLQIFTSIKDWRILKYFPIYNVGAGSERYILQVLDLIQLFC